MAREKCLHTPCILASFPGLPCLFFFVLRFAFSIIHGSGRAAKNGEGLGTLYHMNDVRWTRGGRRGGAVPDYKYVRNKPESKFLTGH